MTDQLNLKGIAGDRTDRLQARKVAILEALRAAGAIVATVQYDGEGDDGQINIVMATDSSGDRIDLIVPFCSTADECVLRTSNSLYEAIEDYCWELLDAYHCGFQDNDGGFGEFTIDVAEGTVTLEKNDRYVSYHTSELEV